MTYYGCKSFQFNNSNTSFNINIQDPFFILQNNLWESTWKYCLNLKFEGIKNNIKIYILVSDLFQKYDNKFVLCVGIFSLIFIHIFEKNQKSWNFSLCWQLKNSKWILCSRKTDIKCLELSFLMCFFLKRYIFCFSK